MPITNGGAARQIVFSMKLDYDARASSSSLQAMNKAVTEQAKSQVTTAQKTAKQVAEMHDKFFSTSRANQVKDEEKLTSSLMKIWERRHNEQRKLHERAAQATTRDTQLLSAQLSGIRDSALGVAKAMAYASMIGEKDMKKLTSELLTVESAYGGVKHGLDVLRGVQGAGRTLQRMGQAGTVSSAIGAVGGVLANPLTAVGVGGAAAVGGLGYAYYQNYERSKRPKTDYRPNWALGIYCRGMAQHGAWGRNGTRCKSRTKRLPRVKSTDSPF